MQPVGRSIEMRGARTAEFTQSDILFLIETASPALLSKIDTIKDDPDIIEGMMEREARRLFQRIMLLSEETITTAISPRFFFDLLLRNARRDLEGQVYTVERTAKLKIPVFDTPEVARFLSDKVVMKYLADLLTSFTRIESFTIPVRVRRGVWRKIRFNDMDLDSLLRFCQAIDEEHRFGFYKRIADLCLFILGMFPEYVIMDYRYPYSGETRPKLFGRMRRSAEDYEEEGRRFYKLAGEHRDATTLDLNEVMGQLHEKFNLAKKPLNYISEHFLQFRKGKLFPSLYAN
jgi:hypothetical protein